MSRARFVPEIDVNIVPSKTGTKAGGYVPGIRLANG